MKINWNNYGKEFFKGKDIPTGKIIGTIDKKQNPQLDPYMGSEWEQLRKNGDWLFNYLKNKSEEQAMDKVVIELEEKYRPSVEKIRNAKYGYTSNSLVIASNEISNTYFNAMQFKEIEELSQDWFNSVGFNNVAKTIERIHSADEVKFIEVRKKWKLRDEYKTAFNTDFRYFHFNILGDWKYVYERVADQLTESSFKRVLINTNCPIPFEKWEGVEV